MALDETDYSLYITEPNRRRLEDILQQFANPSNEWQKKNFERLIDELDRANVVDPRDVPADVVTMDSKVQLRDLDSGEKLTFTLVFPLNADFSQRKVSVLAPIGSAVLGYREGSVVEWDVPSGRRRLKIEKVLYQPEAAGDLDE